jgi:hypothetical protein
VRKLCFCVAAASLERHCRDAFRGLRTIVSAGEKALASRVIHASLPSIFTALFIA